MCGPPPTAIIPLGTHHKERAMRNAEMTILLQANAMGYYPREADTKHIEREWMAEHSRRWQPAVDAAPTSKARREAKRQCNADLDNTLQWAVRHVMDALVAQGLHKPVVAADADAQVDQVEVVALHPDFYAVADEVPMDADERIRLAPQMAGALNALAALAANYPTRRAELIEVRDDLLRVLGLRDA